MSIDDVEGDEGDRGRTHFVFTVTRTGDISAPATVRYHTEDGTAKAGRDYDRVRDALLSFSAGQATRTLTIKVVGDEKSAPDEIFYVVLSDAEGAVIGDGRGEGMIRFDDPLLRIYDTTVTEPRNGTVRASFLVKLTWEAYGPVTFHWRTVDGSAKAGLDYRAVNDATVTVPAGRTRVRVEVVVKADALREPTQNFFVQLFDATGPYGPLRFKDGSAEALIYDR